MLFENCLLQFENYALHFENFPYFLRIEKEQGCILPEFRPENQANNEVFLKAKKRAGSYFLAYKELTDSLNCIKM